MSCQDGPQDDMMSVIPAPTAPCGPEFTTTLLTFPPRERSPQKCRCRGSSRPSEGYSHSIPSGRRRLDRKYGQQRLPRGGTTAEREDRMQA